VKQIQDGDDSSDDGDYVVYTISSVCSPKQGIILMVDLAGSQVQMKLDTGAAVSIVSEKTYHTQLSSWPLESSSVKLKTYGGEPIQVLEKLTLPVKYENQSHNLPLYVVVGDKPALFGRDWLAKMQIDWKRIFKVQQTAYPSPDTGTQGTPAKDITGTKEQYATVFSDKGGPIKEFAAHIYVAENANPVFCKARPVHSRQRWSKNFSVYKMKESSQRLIAVTGLHLLYQCPNQMEVYACVETIRFQ
jgi:hypothetical protein